MTTGRVTHDDLVAWATYTVVMHQPRPEDDRGLTCDERGCYICNSDGATECIADLVARCLTDNRGVPDASEVADAREELAAQGGRLLTPCRPRTGGRGQATRVHLVPPHPQWPELLARRAICGAEPKGGLYPVGPIEWNIHPDATCPRCLTARTPYDLTATPGGSL